MKKTILTVLCTVLLTSGTILGQSVQRITLEDAIRISLENNYLLKQSENDLDQAEFAITSAKADFLPNLNANFRGSRNIGRSFDNLTGQVVDDPVNSLSFSLSTSVPIFTGFQNINNLRSIEQSKLSAEEELQRNRETIIFNTATAFLQIILTEQLLEIARENLVSAEKQLELIKAGVEVGNRAVVEQYNQEATVANFEFEITSQENQLDINKLQLIRILQVDPVGNYEFITPEINSETISYQEFNLSELIDNALSNRADLKGARANINALKYNLNIAKGAILPSLSLSAGFSTAWNERLKDAGFNFNDQFFDQNINRSISLNLSIPIFNNLNTQGGIMNSSVTLKNAELGLDNLRLNVIQEVTQAYNDYTSYVKEVEATEKALFANQKSFETQQERYNVGASTLIELRQAQSDFVQAQSNYTRSLFNVVFQEKVLDFYLGKLSGQNIEF
jgi:outer membrane protein